jgi:hypothetical protein
LTTAVGQNAEVLLGWIFKIDGRRTDVGRGRPLPGTRQAGGEAGKRKGLPNGSPLCSLQCIELKIFRFGPIRYWEFPLKTRQLIPADID